MGNMLLVQTKGDIPVHEPKLDGVHSHKCTSFNKSVDILQQLVTTSLYKFVSGCVCMACNSLLTTSLLQVVNKLVAS